MGARRLPACRLSSPLYGGDPPGHRAFRPTPGCGRTPRFPAAPLDAATTSALALQPMVDVERFRILLLVERDRKLALLPALRRDIASVNAARQDSNVDDEHDPEGVTIAFELSQASALLEQSRQGLAQVEAALARIDAGSYGSCEVCGEEIAEGRLEARPWTPYCIRHSAGPAGTTARTSA